MEFANCVIFVKETNEDLSTHREFANREWNFYAIGNIGDSKKTDSSRLTDPNDRYECCVEIMDVELRHSDFPTDSNAIADLEADNFDEKGTYGFRYIWEDGTDEENAEVFNYCKQKWIDFYRFVITSTDEQFKANLKDYVALDSVLYYYLFTTRYTMVDNRAKNLFFHYGKTNEVDTQGNPIRKWDLSWDYDNDTALGINNYGDMVYRYGLEDTDVDEVGSEIFRESDSTFFCRLRDLFADELKAMYQTLESQNAWHGESLINQFDEWQNQFPEELWRVDIQRKYIRTYNSSFISGEGDSQFLVNMAKGRKKYQRRQFERNQEKYMASKYQSSVASGDNSVFRCSVPTGNLVVKPNYKLKLTPYAYMYLNVKYGTQSPIQLRAEPNKVYEIPFTGDKADIVDVYSSSLIQDFGDLSTCYVATADTTKASKVKKLIFGNSTRGYDNPNFTTLTTGANYLLEVLNIENVSGLTQSLNLSALNNLKELYAHGSNIGGVTFADGGKIEIAELPAINALTMKNLIYLTTLDITDFSKMTTLTVENCNTVDLLTILNKATNINRARITGINWSLNDTSLLERLYAMKGIDKNGYNTDQSVLTGTVSVPVIGQYELYKYQEAWSDLTIVPTTVIKQFVVTFKNDDGTVLDIQHIDQFENAVDPITREENPISIPTKKSTISHSYTYAGWDSSLINIIEDRTITATYTESLRDYTVQYVSKGVIVQSTVGKYGENVIYTGDIPTYTAEEPYTFYLFNRWDKSGFLDNGFDANGVKTVNAIYDKFEYTSTAFTGKELEDLSPVEIYAMNKLGLAKEVIMTGDTYSFSLGSDFTYDDIESVEIIGKNSEFGDEYKSTVEFDGTNYFDTGIQLFDEDKDFILAIDYEFSNATANAVLAQCYQGNGSVGFKLQYNSGVQLKWGSNTSNVAGVKQREMIVLRHKKGDTNLTVYSSKLDSIQVDISTLASKEFTSTTSLVFGCEKQTSTIFANYASGKVHWAKIWYKDLGEDVCKNLALWTHEKIGFKVCGFNRYYLSDNPDGMSSFSLLASHLLERTRQWNNSDSNVGGWAKSELNSFLNTRLYNAIPTQIRVLVKPVIVWSSIGGGSTSVPSTELSSSNCYITIPSVKDIDGINTSGVTNTDPYNSESFNSISYFSTTDSRKMAFDGGDYEDYWLRSPTITYPRYVWRVEKDGSLYSISQANSKYGVLIELSF